MTIKINKDEVFRNEWGELYVDVHDKDNVFMYSQHIDEDLYRNTGAVVPDNWQQQMTNDYRWSKK